MLAAMKVAQAVEALDTQGEEYEKPVDQQAVGMVMRHVFESVSILGIVETLVFDLPSGFGEGIERSGSDARGREVG